MMNTCRPSGGKDRHLKVNTSKGPRDRRIRLSMLAAIQLYDIQDRLGYNQPSKALEWLIRNAQHAISELKALPCIAADRGRITAENHQSIIETSRQASAADGFPRSKSFLDAYSNAGGLLSKESYDSRFTESATLRTLHHVSNAQLDFDGQTHTRDEESERAKSLEQRSYSEGMSGCRISEAACEEIMDVGCSTVKIDSRFKARERAKERAKVRSLFRMRGQKDNITSSRFMPSEVAPQPIISDNNVSRSLNSSKSFENSESRQDPDRLPILPVQATPPNSSLNSTEFLKQNTGGNVSQFPQYLFPPPSQPQNIYEMFQLRSIANDVLHGSLQPGMPSTLRANYPHETPFSVSYFPAPGASAAVYQYLSTSSHPLFQAVTMNQLSALGSPNYSQQEVFCHSQAYRQPEFLPASMNIYTNTPTNYIPQGNINTQDRISSWQGRRPQTFGHVMSIDSSSACNTRTLVSQERPNDQLDPAVQYFSDMARSLSPPAPAPSNRQDFIHER